VVGFEQPCQLGHIRFVAGCSVRCRVEQADRREQDLLLASEVRLEIGSQLADEVSHRGQLRVAVTVHRNDLVDQGGDARQLGPEVAVVDGLDVVGQSGRGERRPRGRHVIGTLG
jgi:hypothetical protein